MMTAKSMATTSFLFLKAEVARCAYEDHARCTQLCREAAAQCSDQQLYELTCMIFDLVEQDKRGQDRSGQDQSGKGTLLDTRA